MLQTGTLTAAGVNAKRKRPRSICSEASCMSAKGLYSVGSRKCDAVHIQGIAVADDVRGIAVEPGHIAVAGQGPGAESLYSCAQEHAASPEGSAYHHRLSIVMIYVKD